jgi:hypothetical protein
MMTFVELQQYLIKLPMGLRNHALETVVFRFVNSGAVDIQRVLPVDGQMKETVLHCSVSAANFTLDYLSPSFRDSFVRVSQPTLLEFIHGQP